jgi:hypothetical protein
MPEPGLSVPLDSQTHAITERSRDVGQKERPMPRPVRLVQTPGASSRPEVAFLKQTGASTALIDEPAPMPS